jgi:ATP/ADP translocase
MYIYTWMGKNVLNDIDLYDPDKHAPKTKKKKPGFTESLKLIFSSGYIAKIACCVLCYGSIVNFLVSFQCV